MPPAVPALCAARYLALHSFIDSALAGATPIDVTDARAKAPMHQVRVDQTDTAILLCGAPRSGLGFASMAAARGAEISNSTDISG